MRIRLDKHWTDQLLKWPESGMGYQRVDVTLADAVARGASLGLTDDEVAFYDALETNEQLAPDTRVRATGDRLRGWGRQTACDGATGYASGQARPVRVSAFAQRQPLSNRSATSDPPWSGF